ncbi:hypothetical protein [Aliiroseovarius marinus]|uniref:hypothetical protein n=1 Tax=Aliiroseovarius marinus TaxID=2500159 RepID=UPI003D7C5DF9
MSIQDGTNSRAPRSIGSVLTDVQGRGQSKALSPSSKSKAASYSEVKQAWSEQVAADKALTGIALRIALAFPKWLNRESLLAWPAQSTLAEVINSQVRSVRAALKLMEERGHLVCVSEFRGGRQTNRYRIVLQKREITPVLYEHGSIDPVREVSEDRCEGMPQSGPSGSQNPVCADRINRGTPERTQEYNNDAQNAAGEEEQLRQRVTPQRAAEIMREVMGDDRVSETGFLSRE